MNIILTGCDKNTEWQLPWFVKNFNKFCAGTDCKLAVANFGMTESTRKDIESRVDFVIDFVGDGGWFNKVKLFYTTHQFFGPDANICWLDTDCELKRCPTIFQLHRGQQVHDGCRPPLDRERFPLDPQGNCGPWYNTGVVAYRGRPQIIIPWLKECETGNHRGDQEALYNILNQDPGMRFANIAEVSHRYNVLRLDLLQDRVPDDPCVIHWTGQKGKEEIKRQMTQ